MSTMWLGVSLASAVTDEVHVLVSSRCISIAFGGAVVVQGEGHTLGWSTQMSSFEAFRGGEAEYAIDCKLVLGLVRL